MRILTYVLLFLCGLILFVLAARVGAVLPGVFCVGLLFTALAVVYFGVRR